MPPSEPYLELDHLCDYSGLLCLRLSPLVRIAKYWVWIRQYSGVGKPPELVRLCRFAAQRSKRNRAWSDLHSNPSPTARNRVESRRLAGVSSGLLDRGDTCAACSLRVCTVHCITPRYSISLPFALRSGTRELYLRYLEPADKKTKGPRS